MGFTSLNTRHGLDWRFEIVSPFCFHLDLPDCAVVRSHLTVYLQQKNGMKSELGRDGLPSAEFL